MDWWSAAKRMGRWSLPVGLLGGADGFDLIRHSSIVAHGWLLSRRRGLAVDGAGAPIPWYTYAAISFLIDRLPGELDVFEYGCGYSTLWWMQRARSVTSVEQAGAWADAVRRRAASHVRIIEAAQGDDSYVRSIAGTNQLFDVVVVDGENRDACLRLAPFHLKPDGIVILDNADRPEYHDSMQYLRDQGFQHVDFIGMGPINTYDWTTSIFYRRSNRIGL